jgi:hypothetical protein
MHPRCSTVSNNETELLNSRLVNGYYIIDGKPAKLSLVLGVGDQRPNRPVRKIMPNSLFNWGGQ